MLFVRSSEVYSCLLSAQVLQLAPHACQIILISTSYCNNLNSALRSTILVAGLLAVLYIFFTFVLSDDDEEEEETGTGSSTLKSPSGSLEAEQASEQSQNSSSESSKEARAPADPFLRSPFAAQLGRVPFQGLLPKLEPQSFAAALGGWVFGKLRPQLSSTEQSLQQEGRSPPEEGRQQPPEGVDRRDRTSEASTSDAALPNSEVFVQLTMPC